MLILLESHCIGFTFWHRHILIEFFLKIIISTQYVRLFCSYAKHLVTLVLINVINDIQISVIIIVIIIRVK